VLVPVISKHTNPDPNSNLPKLNQLFSELQQIPILQISLLKTSSSRKDANAVLSNIAPLPVHTTFSVIVLTDKQANSGKISARPKLGIGNCILHKYNINY